ncbi:MAG: phosphoribosyl-dephospho-CoA transferase MdcG domain-containing protein [Isosphaeraceae bacterium]
MTRQQRFAAFLAVAEITDRLSPEDLAASPHVIERERKDAVPALAALARVATVLACRGQCWGPGGSIGFEIATGVAAATPSSDLDLILRQDRRLGPDEAVDLRAALAEAAAPARVDVLLETPVAASRSRTSPRGQSKCSCARQKALVLRPIPGG